MKKIWGLQNSRGRMIALFIVDILSVILDSYLAIILRFKLDYLGTGRVYVQCRELYGHQCYHNGSHFFGT